ncbi:CCN family member 2-like [Lampris incognitus]|uniref:CCN family member 2-like n=1 Tax=Lampris incognitus TaxID=2546036 RepID=UPI0024B514B4|nr:CCN family member 2-like [Lampris incognitus]
MDRRDAVLFGSVFLCISITQVWCQLCGGPCQCQQTAPRCPLGVPLVLDGCHCCQVCARQEGEACTDRLPCDRQRGLRCDYSSSYPGEPGECVGENALGCDLNGMRLEEGQTFQPSCAQLCHCLGGGVTCVSLCTDELQMPKTNCPNPRWVRLPGRCCTEWVCDGLDNNILPDASVGKYTMHIGLNPLERTAERVDRAHLDHRGGLSGSTSGLISNCIEQNTDWSPCSRSCGPGVSTRSSNKNWACRLLTETRLCQVRPCQALPHVAHRLQRGSGMCEMSYRSPSAIRLEHQGCWSAQAFRPRFCGPACSEGRCCSPHHTRTMRMVFHCPQGRLTLQQVMMIESCSCGNYNCPQPLSTAPWRPMSWL